VIEQGPRSARNVLVLAPGTSGRAAYLRPIARDLVARLPGWKVWSVDRRENLLEDHAVLGPVVARERRGGVAYAYCRSALIKDDAGRPVGVIGLSMNVSPPL
jgi:hypothetical protein